MTKTKTPGKRPSSGKEGKTLGVIRANLKSCGERELSHLRRVAAALGRAANVDAVVLAVPDDDLHRERAGDVDFCETFAGDATNMGRRMLAAARDREASRIVDCSLLTQCLDPRLYEEIVDFHTSSPNPLTRPRLWYPEYLPNVVDTGTLEPLAENFDWPYYARVDEAGINWFTPDVDAFARSFSFLDPLCQELVIHKGRRLCGSMNLAVHPYDPVKWATRCAYVLEKIDTLFNHRSVSVLEVGCGKRFGMGILLRMAGVERYQGIDLNLRPVSDEHIRVFGEWLAMAPEVAAIPGMVPLPLGGDEGTPGAHSFLGGTVSMRDMNACTLDFADETFDFVFSDAVLEHIAECSSAIAETYRVLKPGGYAVHSIDFKDHETQAGDSHLFLSKEAWHERHRPRLIHLTRPADAYEWFRQAGFEILSISEDKFPDIDPSRVHGDHLAHGLSDAATCGAHLVMRKPEQP